MELRLEHELAEKVEQWSVETGRPAHELIEGAIEGYFNEVAQLKETLDRRFGEIVDGKVEGLDGPETVQLIKDRAAARRKLIA